MSAAEAGGLLSARAGLPLQGGYVPAVGQLAFTMVIADKFVTAGRLCAAYSAACSAAGIR